MVKTIGYAASSSHSPLKPYDFERRGPVKNEVEIEILFCGICHSDLHQVENDWKNTIYPCLPGHEIVGKVTKLGSTVQKYKIGDIVGVGCMIDSCQKCSACEEGLENYCESEEGFLATYNGNLKKPTKDNLTFGGYSNKIVVREDFVLKIPAGLELSAAAPILCAGVTTYSPMKHWGVKAGDRVAIIAVGGLGHMAIKIAKALGAKVTAITTSPHKTTDAKSYGAEDVIISSDDEQMKASANKFDFILSTIPEPHDPNPYIALVKRDGIFVMVGVIAPLSKPLDTSKMLIDRKTFGTSLIGGIAETQEVLDFCAKHGIAPTVKIVSIDSVNDVFKEMKEKTVDFRYVIDMKTIYGKKAEESLLEKIGF